MSTTDWAYVDTSTQVGDLDYLKVFATADAAATWFAENDPEGVAFQDCRWITPDFTVPNDKKAAS